MTQLRADEDTCQSATLNKLKNWMNRAQNYEIEFGQVKEEGFGKSEKIYEDLDEYEYLNH